MIPVSVIVTTRNEAANIEPIVRAALAQLEQAVPGQHHLLIVDDSSPDGTGQIADRLAAELDPVEVLHRPEKRGLRGLSRSVRRDAIQGERAAEYLIRGY